MTKNIPVDSKLYSQVKSEAKQKFKKWPSAYASGWLVNTYKKRFEKKHGSRKSPYKIKKSSRKSSRKTSKKDSNKLSRWYDEEWVNVCEKDSKGNYKPCGRKKSNAKKYPYCRPFKRITSKTPKTVGELTRAERKRMCSKKRKTSPYKTKKPTRVYVSSLKRKSSTRKNTRKNGGKKPRKYICKKSEFMNYLFDNFQK